MDGRTPIPRHSVPGTAILPPPSPPLGVMERPVSGHPSDGPSVKPAGQPDGAGAASLQWHTPPRQFLVIVPHGHRPRTAARLWMCYSGAIGSGTRDVG